jgi:hypothetical protein
MKIRIMHRQPFALARAGITLEGEFKDLGKGPPRAGAAPKKKGLLGRLFKKAEPPPFPPHMNPVFVTKDGWLKRLGNKTKRMLKGVAVVGIGVLLLYSFILWQRMYKRIQYLKQYKKPEPPFVDPVAYLMDAWPRMPIPRVLAEKAVDRFLKSKQFRQTSEILSSKQQSGLADRLRKRAEGMPNKRLTDQQLATRAQSLSKILERESEDSGSAGGRMTASDMGY